MVAAMGDGTKIPTDLIPRCPHCGGEAFPWVRGYGNFLQGKKIRRTVRKNFSLCAGTQRQQNSVPGTGRWRMTPMFIQEPFWNLTSFPMLDILLSTNKYDFLPKQLEDKGMTIVATLLKCYGMHENDR